jgi:hypothetical protein
LKILQRTLSGHFLDRFENSQLFLGRKIVLMTSEKKYFSLYARNKDEAILLIGIEDQTLSKTLNETLKLALSCQLGIKPVWQCHTTPKIISPKITSPKIVSPKKSFHLKSVHLKSVHLIFISPVKLLT